MDGKPATKWAWLTSFIGFTAETEANLLVCTLQGHDIPAVRLPVQPVTVLVAAGPAIILPIAIWVAADHLDEARALAAGQPAIWTPQPVRRVMQWYVAASFVTMLWGAWLTFFRQEEGPSRWVSSAFGVVHAITVIAELAMLWAGINVIAWLYRKRRPLPDARVLVVATVVWIVLAIVTATLIWLANYIPQVL